MTFSRQREPSLGQQPWLVGRLQSVVGGKPFSHVVTLVGGAAITQAIPVLFSFVLSRVYAPDAHGQLAVFTSVAGLGAMLVTIQYAQAIMLSSDDDEAFNTLLLAGSVCVAISALAMVTLTMLHHYEVPIGFLSKLGRLVFLVPASVLLSGLGMALNNWSNKQREYRRISVSGVIGAGASVVIQLVWAMVTPTSTGLIVGYVVGQGASLSAVAILAYRAGDFIGQSACLRQLKALAIEHRQFVFFATPSAMIVFLTDQIPIISIATLWSDEQVGYLGLSRRVLIMPVNLLAMAISRVFYDRAGIAFRETGSCHEIAKKVVCGLSAFAAIPTILLGIFLPSIFGTLFGSVWIEAGYYARIMLLPYFVRFVILPVSPVFYIAGRQRELAGVKLFSLVSSGIGVLIGISLGHGPRDA